MKNKFENLWFNKPISELFKDDIPVLNTQYYIGTNIHCEPITRKEETFHYLYWKRKNLYTTFYEPTLFACILLITGFITLNYWAIRNRKSKGGKYTLYTEGGIICLVILLLLYVLIHNRIQNKNAKETEATLQTTNTLPTGLQTIREVTIKKGSKIYHEPTLGVLGMYTAIETSEVTSQDYKITVDLNSAYKSASGNYWVETPEGWVSTQIINWADILANLTIYTL